MSDTLGILAAILVFPIAAALLFTVGYRLAKGKRIRLPRFVPIGLSVVALAMAILSLALLAANLSPGPLLLLTPPSVVMAMLVRLLSERPSARKKIDTPPHRPIV